MSTGRAGAGARSGARNQRASSPRSRSSRPSRAAQASHSEQGPQRSLPTFLLVGLYLVALAGRFSLDRLGFPALPILSLQVLGGVGIVVATLVWRVGGPRRGYYHPWIPGIQLSILFFFYLASSLLWSPLTPFAFEVFIDILVLVGLLAATSALTGPDPKRAAEVITWLLYATGIFYAVTALVMNTTNVQGRLTFIGGGPNVFVRVVLLGALAAVALAISKRKPLLLLPVPLLVYAGVLSGSRGGLVAFALTIPLLLYAFRDKIRATIMALVALGPPLLAVFLFQTSTGSSFVERIVDLFEGRGLSERDTLLVATYDLFIEHPWIGTGIGGFYEQYGQRTSLEYPHNFVAAVGAEAGVVGLILLAVTAFALLARIRPLSRLSPEQICCFLGAAFLAAASLISGDYYDSRFCWILLIIAVNAGIRPGSLISDVVPRRRRMSRAVGGLAAPAASEPAPDDEANTRQIPLPERAVDGQADQDDNTTVLSITDPSPAAPGPTTPAPRPRMPDDEQQGLGRRSNAPGSAGRSAADGDPVTPPAMFDEVPRNGEYRRGPEPG